MTMMNDKSHIWKKVTEALPETGKLVLVRGITHDGIALGKYYDENFQGSFWDVQPFRSAWYFTANGIREWREIED